MVHGLSVEQKKRYLFFSIFAGVLVIAYFLLQSLLTSVLAGVLLSYILFPAYQMLQKFLKRDALAAVVLLVSAFLLILVPALFLVERLGSEAVQFYAYSKNLLEQGIPCLNGDSFGCRVAKTINAFLNEPSIAYYSEILVKQTSSVIVEAISGIALKSLQYLFNLLTVFFVAYYCFLDGQQWASYIENFLPFKDETKRAMASQLRAITSSIVFSFLLVALLEGILGFIAFFLVGIHSPLLWGIIIAFTAMVPFISSTPIWVPAFLYQLYMGRFIAAAILLFFGFLLFYVDNFVRSMFVGVKTNIHPLLIFLGLLGGLELLGVVGIILGPFILSFSLLLLKVYLAEK
ncbi:AI-2E family transporter [Candidatus Woesearchaeota archaeon]|nr:AI-2E family transporter [Candidatus Woesearchaeota archaeon]